MNSKGFTLVEMLIVIAILAILMSIATMQFNRMNENAAIESRIRGIYHEITNFRLEAITRKQRCAVFIGSSTLDYWTYTNNTGVIARGPENLPDVDNLRTTNLSGQISRVTGGGLVAFDLNADRIDLDSRGFTANNMTIVALPLKINEVDNCIIVANTRTSIGRMTNATTCTAR